MKKIFAMLLALSLVFALAACGGEKGGEENTKPAVFVPADALALLNGAWNNYTEEQKFPVIGGSMAAPVDGAPGGWELTDENISYSLLIPAEQLGNVTEAASMIHMMNANTFTAAAFKLADGVSAADFGAAMKEAVLNNQWMCGFPEQLLILDVGAGAYVTLVFGVKDMVDVFQTNLAAAYPDFTELVNEAIV